jgi:hypothetical protein
MAQTCNFHKLAVAQHEFGVVPLEGFGCFYLVSEMIRSE